MASLCEPPSCIMLVGGSFSPLSTLLHGCDGIPGHMSRGLPLMFTPSSSFLKHSGGVKLWVPGSSHEFSIVATGTGCRGEILDNIKQSHGALEAPSSCHEETRKLHW